MHRKLQLKPLMRSCSDVTDSRDVRVFDSGVFLKTSTVTDLKLFCSESFRQQKSAHLAFSVIFPVMFLLLHAVHRSTAESFSSAVDEPEPFHQLTASPQVSPAKGCNLSPECPGGRGSHYRPAGGGVSRVSWTSALFICTSSPQL